MQGFRFIFEWSFINSPERWVLTLMSKCEYHIMIVRYKINKLRTFRKPELDSSRLRYTLWLQTLVTKENNIYSTVDIKMEIIFVCFFFVPGGYLVMETWYNGSKEWMSCLTISPVSTNLLVSNEDILGRFVAFSFPLLFRVARK